MRYNYYYSKMNGRKNPYQSADNYVLQISDSVPADNVARQLILAAVMFIDMVLKE